ncbi:hypothetical protein PLICRDRAFT_56922 [Plicaturopsis crispa FD-325 SS-3]|nr:hypothetical protein PLICRDRAFT_56922 [Plicaturopsis crispa FD-325 SS-3]
MTRIVVLLTTCCSPPLSLALLYADYVYVSYAHPMHSLTKTPRALPSRRVHHNRERVGQYNHVHRHQEGVQWHGLSLMHESSVKHSVNPL